MPFQVYLSPTTASPPDAQVQADMRVAVMGEGAIVGPDGATLRTTDGARVRQARDGEHFLVDRLSPAFCRILFNAALRSNSTVDRAGSDVVPLQMLGSKGDTLYVRIRMETIATPADLCVRLQRDLGDWTRYVKSSQAMGMIGADEQLLEPPADPGTEARLAAEPSGLAARCEAHMASLAHGGWRTLRTVVSRNPRYGVVWRADSVTAEDSQYVSRIICWCRPVQRRPDNLAFEIRPLQMLDPRQSVPPLAP